MITGSIDVATDVEAACTAAGGFDFDDDDCFHYLDAEDDIETIGEIGSKDMKFATAANSPSGEALLLVSNEVSGTLAIFSVSAL